MNVFYNQIKNLTDAAEIHRTGRAAVIDLALANGGLSKRTTKERNEKIKTVEKPQKLNYLMILADQRGDIPFVFSEKGNDEKRYVEISAETEFIPIEKTDQQENIAAVAASITTHIDFDRFLSELLMKETVNISDIAGAYVEVMNKLNKT